MTAPHEPPELNYIVLTGKVMEKGELRTTSLQIFHIRFRLENCVVPSFDGPGDDKKTYVLDVEAWGSLAEDVDRNIRNGMFVLLEGSLVSRSYIDKMKRMQYRMVVKASEITALST
jgi:single-stranded DNA-binding protein